MKITEFKSLVKECVKEIIQEKKVNEIYPDRRRVYPSSESRIFDSIVSTIRKPENEEKLEHDRYKIYKLKDVYLTEDSKKIIIFNKDVLANKTKSDNTIKYKNGDVNDLKNILKHISDVNEINGTPEFSHENYGMLESEENEEGDFKYSVSYKLYNDKNQLIRIRNGVEIFGPDFGEHKEEEKKYLENKAFQLEMDLRKESNKRNKDIPSITGKPLEKTGDVKIVGLMVKKKSDKDPYKDIRKSTGFDADTVKKLSAPMAPGSRVD